MLKPHTRLALVGGLLLAPALSVVTAEPQGRRVASKAAPEFHMTFSDGSRLSSRALSGKVIFLTFFEET